MNNADGARASRGPRHAIQLHPKGNQGHAGGNNFGARHATGDVLFFLNPDTVVEKGTVAELARTLEDRSIGIVMPRLRLMHEPDKLNSSGNIIHISGLAWAGGYDRQADSETELRDVAFPSGAAMAIRADLFHELGAFTEEFFIYQEDLELGWKTHLRGLRVVLNPRGDVYHEYEYGTKTRKYYLLERNRLIVILSAFSGRLLLVLSPAIVSAEVAVTVLALKEGWLKEKAAGWLWCARNARWIVRHRRETQQLPASPDRDLARFLTAVIDPAMISVPEPVRAVNPLMERYWALARRALLKDAGYLRGQGHASTSSAWPHRDDLVAS